MVDNNYDYLLPIFVGHPFKADYTKALREAINTACDRVNNQQSGDGKRFLWIPDFLNNPKSNVPQTIFDKVQRSIRESALCIFEITDLQKVNVFFELGIAIGMQRRYVLLAKTPYQPPSDLQGLERIDYSDMDDLTAQLEEILLDRVQELLGEPGEEEEVFYRKIQIDALWRFHLTNVSKSIHIFAGDMSWADIHMPAITNICKKGVQVQICCARPESHERKKWENIDMLNIPGVKIKLFNSDTSDPKLRGFIVDPKEVGNCTIVLTEKKRRSQHTANYKRTGFTIGEREFLYTAHVYRATSYPRHTVAIARLFETIWDSPQLESYP